MSKIDVNIPLFNLYFPVCHVKGICIPVIRQHLAGKYLVPKKCLDCTMFNEGDCLRKIAEPGVDQSLWKWDNFFPMALDFGFCGIPSTPGTCVASVNRYGETMKCHVPMKCAKCHYFLPSGECCRFFAKYKLPCSLDFSGI